MRKIVLVGASTGGPGQIQKIITALPKLKHTSVIIAQHMTGGLINSFASRLQSISQNTICVAQNNQVFEPAHVYICEGNTYIQKNHLHFIFIQKMNALHAFNPDINVLFSSFIPLSSEFKILSVILTGIGDDGVEACKLLSENGAACITETSESAIVDGMTSRARSEVPDVKAYDISNIVKKISEFCE